MTGQAQGQDKGCLGPRAEDAPFLRAAGLTSVLAGPGGDTLPAPRPARQPARAIHATQEGDMAQGVSGGGKRDRYEGKEEKGEWMVECMRYRRVRSGGQT